VQTEGDPKKNIRIIKELEVDVQRMDHRIKEQEAQLKHIAKRKAEVGEHYQAAKRSHDEIFSGK